MNPSTYSFLDVAIINRLSSLSFESRMPMIGKMSGRHQSPHRGSSVEFAEYRKYVPGDDPRRLDWRAYARSDRFYVKEFEADTNLRCCLVVDASASMSYGSGKGSKLDYARRMAATLAHVLVRQGDAVGLAACRDRLNELIMPARCPSHLQVINRMLAYVQPGEGTGLVEGLHQLSEKLTQRALVIIFSDFLTDEAELRHALQHLRFQRHDVAIFHLFDRRELSFDFETPQRFINLEDETDQVVTEPLLIAEAYHRAVERFRESVRQSATGCQIDYAEVVSDQEIESILAPFLIQRLQRQGMRR